MSHKLKTVAVFKSGNSQAVRLPKEFQFDVHVRELLAERLLLARKG